MGIGAINNHIHDVLSNGSLLFSGNETSAQSQSLDLEIVDDLELLSLNIDIPDNGRPCLVDLNSPDDAVTGGLTATHSSGGALGKPRVPADRSVL